MKEEKKENEVAKGNYNKERKQNDEAIKKETRNENKNLKKVA